MFVPSAGADRACGRMQLECLCRVMFLESVGHRLCLHSPLSKGVATFKKFWHYLLIPTHGELLMFLCISCPAAMAMRRRKGSLPLFCAISAAACCCLAPTNFILLPQAGEFQKLCVCLVVPAFSAKDIHPQWHTDSRWRRPVHWTQCCRFD